MSSRGELFNSRPTEIKNKKRSSLGRIIPQIGGSVKGKAGFICRERGIFMDSQYDN